MCKFVSWKENPFTSRLYYLKNADLDTPEGIKLKMYLDKMFTEDIPGHGAVTQYWEYKGVDISNLRQFEITDFSSPKNFPEEIADAIKAGQFSLIGCPDEPQQLLNKTGMKLLKNDPEWDKACAEWAKARAKWDKAGAELDKAGAEYDKACAEWAKARAEYDKARAKWAKARQSIFWRIFSDPKNRKRAWK